MLRKGNRSLLPNSIEKKILKPLSLLQIFFYKGFGNFNKADIRCTKVVFFSSIWKSLLSFVLSGTTTSLA